jgi:hypothetical protein
MKLKKINEKLREGVDNGLTEANKLQKKLFYLKSGADCTIIAPKEVENQLPLDL